MSEVFYISEMSPFGSRLRLVAAMTKRDLNVVLPPGGAGSAEMKEINPFGQVPTAVVDGVVLVESQGLMEYLVETGPASALLPEGAVARARVRGIGRAHDNQVVAAMGPIFPQLRSATPDLEVIAKAFGNVAAKAAGLARLFDDAGFAVGALSLADIAVAPFANMTNFLAARFGQESPYITNERLADWWRTVSAVDEVAAEVARLNGLYAKVFK
jgi:glutathione S-transferase